MFFTQLKMPLTMLILFSMGLLFAAQGLILDDSSQPLEGASITDGKISTHSDKRGEFYLNTASDSLLITRLGYKGKWVSSQASRIILEELPITLPTVWVKADAIIPQSPSLSADLIHPDTNAPAMGVSDLLQRSSAFGSSDSPLIGERQTLSILGSFGRHSLVMLDGVTLNASGEAYDLSKIPLEQVDYIEIIKGSASVYGGSSAIGGIIHLHTKKAAQKPLWEGKASFRAGSFGMIGHGYDASFKYHKLSLATQYSHYQAQNNFLYYTPDFWQSEPELKREHNRKTTDSYYLKAEYMATPLLLNYSLNAGTFVRELPGPTNFLDLYDDSRLTGKFQQHTLNCSFTHRDYAQEELIWLNNDQSIYRNLASTIPLQRSNYGQKQAASGFKSSHYYNLEDTKLGLNLEIQHNKYDFLKPPPFVERSVTRDNSALWASVLHQYYPFFLQGKTSLALRADYTEKTLNPTWRIEQEIIWPGKTDLALGGYLGTSFSLPSLFDMYWIGDSQTQGNPNLKNESSTGYSFYLSASNPLIKLKAALYKSQVTELIQWRQYYLNGISWKPFNVGSAELKSYELEAEIPLHRHFTLSGSLTKTEATDKSKNADGSPSPTFDKTLVYTPDLKAALQLAFEHESYGASIRYGYTGEQFSTPDNLIPPLDSFENLDAGFFWSPKIWLLDIALDLKLNNILNHRYEIYAYTPQPGFNWSAGLKIKINK